MAEQRYTETEQLSDVIDVIQLGRKTGSLMVTRGEGGNQETGVVVFLHGQPIQANVGQRTPTESLKWLATWTTCHFVFVPGTPGQPTLPMSTTSQVSPTTTNPSLPANLSLPSPAWHDEGKQQNRGMGNTTSPGRMPPPQPRAYSPLLAVPHRLWPVNEALYAMDQRGFSRNHRRLLLLLDGRRTVKDLSLLMGRSSEEVYILLEQMEKAGFVQLS